MTQKNNPLPCPFCGAEKVSVREGSTYRWVFAECDECGASAGEIRRQYGQGADAPEVIADAIAEWNIRDRREIDRLQRELAEARAFISTIIDAPKDYPAEEGM